jgi:TfoX/Sxy family transcriptional regulator of competence genes
MPFDEGLAERLAECVPDNLGLIETRMFGGFGYMLNGNMCVGIHKDTLIIRVGKEKAEELLKEPNVRPMDLTKRIMKGWATIEPEGLMDDDNLSRYVKEAVTFVETLPLKG